MAQHPARHRDDVPAASPTFAGRHPKDNCSGWQASGRKSRGSADHRHPMSLRFDHQARDTQAMSIEVVLSKAPATKPEAANGHGLQSGHLCVRRHGNPVDEHFSTLAAGDRGRSARIQRGRHFDHHGFSGDFCRRTIDCRPVVGPVRAAKPDPDRALHFRAGNDMVRICGRSVRPADRPIDTSLPAHVRWPCCHAPSPGICSMARRWQR